MQLVYSKNNGAVSNISLEQSRLGRAQGIVFFIRGKRRTPAKNAAEAQRSFMSKLFIDLQLKQQTTSC